MDQVEASPAAVAPRSLHWPLYVAGIVLFVLGPAIYAFQLSAKELVTPWYLPILATIGAALMMLSVWRRFGVVRMIGLVLFALVCAFEWSGLLVVMKSPSYTGPATAGHNVPAFSARLADGRPFTEADLRNGPAATVLLFYRGHW